MGKLQDLAVSSAPTFKCFIPSKGKTVKMRSFLVKEQKLLLMAKESEGEGIEAIVNAVTQLLQNCVLDDIEISKLPSFDVEYMFVQLFMNSTASKQSVAHYQCKAHRKDEAGNDITDVHGEPILCNEINKVKIDLSAAKVPADQIKDGVVTVDSEKIDKIVFLYPSFDQATSIAQAMGGETMDAAFRIYGDCMSTIYKKDGTTLVHGEDYDTDDAVEFLEYLSGSVFEKVTDFFSNIPSISASAHFECKCGNKSEIELRGLDDFF